jgi:hypothetical protein
MGIDMPKLVYWIAPCLDDCEAYNIRAKTKKACEALAKQGNDYKKNTMELSAPAYGPVVKHVIEYKDAFDLMDWCLSEAGGGEPS